MTREMRAKPAGDYEVGYGRTPMETRWQKGQSGNPRGRPKRSNNIAECLHAHLAETRLVEIGGRKRRITYADQVSLRILQAGLQGSLGHQKEMIRQQQIRAEKGATDGWTHIEATLVFPEEENRLVQLAEENRRLVERNSYLEERLKSSEGPR